jgi:TrmH family RNA methyltransferase
MLSKNQIKNITALHQKKFRREENLFIAEGEKIVNDLLHSEWKIKSLFGTQAFFQDISKGIVIPKEVEINLVTEDELKKISSLTTPQKVLAVVSVPDNEYTVDFERGLKLVLDNISDPGNLGTLIRIAAWFGIDEVICSDNSVECFNPKVVQSSMGALFHINISYSPLTELFQKNISIKSLPVYGTMLEGENIYQEKLLNDAFIIVGNESTGISKELFPFITQKIKIPSFGKRLIDSLNVAVATGIVCAEFRKNNQ